MRRSPTPILLWAALLVALSAGCQSPQTRWAVARETLTQTERGLMTANANQILSDKDFVATEKYVLAARAAIKRAEDELNATGGQGSMAFDSLLDLIESTLRQLQPFIEKGGAMIDTVLAVIGIIRTVEGAMAAFLPIIGALHEGGQLSDDDLVAIKQRAEIADLEYDAAIAAAKARLGNG